jgi:hypothetical protein
MSFDDFADLNAAIADQLKLKQTADAAKAAAKRLPRLPTNSAQAAADRALVAEWEAQHLWQAHESIALFELEECLQCETVSERFVQYMQLDRARRNPETTRCFRVAEPAEGLPRKVLRQRKLSPICPDCAEASGWLLGEAEEVCWQDPAPTPAADSTADAEGASA